MVTTIQVGEDTQKKLFAKVAELEELLGRRGSYDEAINLLLDEPGETREARIQFTKLFGALKNDKKVWMDLRSLRREEKSMLGRLTKKKSRTGRKDANLLM